MPIVFNQATPYQLEIIIKLIQKENRKMLARETLSKEDIINCFDLADERHAGSLPFEEVIKVMETLQVGDLAGAVS